MLLNIEFQNCDIKLKHIGTKEDHEVREYCYEKGLKYSPPLSTRGKPRSKSPKKELIKGMRYYINSILQYV